MAKSRETKDKHFVKKPVYEGGLTALRQFIKDNMKYPKIALNEKIEGTVFVKYTVNHKGKVTEAKVVSGLGHGCDKEAIRLVKLLQFSVSKHYKLRVLFHKSIKIHFRLPKVKPNPKIKKEQSMKVQYNYVTSPKKANKNQKTPPKDGGYTYTINY